jgi:hypothetical protein
VEEAILFFLLGVFIVFVKSIWLLLFIIIGSPFISFSFSDVLENDSLRRLLGGGGTLALRRANRADDAARLLFDDVVGLVVVVVFVMTLFLELNSTLPTLLEDVVATIALLLGGGV